MTSRATTSTSQPEGERKRNGQKTHSRNGERKRKEEKTHFQSLSFKFILISCDGGVAFGIGSSLDYFNSQKWSAVTMSGRGRENVQHATWRWLNDTEAHDGKRKTCKFLIVFFLLVEVRPAAHSTWKFYPWNFHFFSETYFSHLRPDRRRLIDIRFFFFVRPPPPPRRSNRLTIKYFVMINRIGWKFLNCERTRTSAWKIVKFFIHSCFTLF